MARDKKKQKWWLLILINESIIFVRYPNDGYDGGNTTNAYIQLDESVYLFLIGYLKRLVRKSKDH